MYSDVTGIILAGGKSSRMGVNKSLLKIGNKTVIEIITDLMESIFEKNILSTNSPAEFNFLKLPMVEDVYENCGPLGGIHSVLIQSKTERNFIISCDVPLMKREMIKYFVNYKSGKKIILSFASGYLQPLVGIYNKSLLPEIEKILTVSIKENYIRSHKSLHKLIENSETEIIDPTSLPFYRDELFFNLNNNEDYAKIKLLL